MGRHKRIYTQQEIDTAVGLVRNGVAYEDVSRQMGLIFHKKFSPSELNVKVRQAQGFLPLKDEPAAHLPRLNGVTPPRPGLLPHSNSAKQVKLLPNSVNEESEIVREDPVDFLDNLISTDTLQYVNPGPLPFQSTQPRIEDIPNMFLDAVNDVVNSIPGIAVNSWKNRMQNSMWTKFNPPIPNESQLPIDRSNVEFNHKMRELFKEHEWGKKVELLEPKRIDEEPRREDQNLKPHDPHDTAGESSDFVSPPDRGLAQPSMDGLSLRTAPIQLVSAAGTVGLDEQKTPETELKKPAEPPVAPPGIGSDAGAVNGSDSKKSEPPIELKTKVLSKPNANAGDMTSQPPTIIPAAQPPTIETPIVRADSISSGSQLLNGASNSLAADHTLEPIITQDTYAPVQPTTIQSPSISAPSPIMTADVKEVKEEISNPEAFRQIESCAIHNSNGNLLQRAIWMTAGVGILGLAIYVFNPQLRRWIFSHFTRFIQVSQRQFRGVTAPHPQSPEASLSPEVPTLYSVPAQSSETSFQSAQGYARVNNPNGAALF